MPQDFFTDSFWQWIGAIALGLVTSFFGWVFGRRSQNADAALNEIKASREALEIWRETSEQLREEVAGVKRDYYQLKEELAREKLTNIELRKKNEMLELEVVKLKHRLAKLTGQI